MEYRSAQLHSAALDAEHKTFLWVTVMRLFDDTSKVNWNLVSSAVSAGSMYLTPETCKAVWDSIDHRLMRKTVPPERAKQIWNDGITPSRTQLEQRLSKIGEYAAADSLASMTAALDGRLREPHDSWAAAVAEHGKLVDPIALAWVGNCARMDDIDEC